MVLGAICSTIDIIAPPLKLQAFLMIDDVGAHISRAIENINLAFLSSRVWKSALYSKRGFSDYAYYF